MIFLPQPPKPAPSEPPAPASHGRQCCRAGLTAPSYSHPWPVYPSTHPHLLLFSGDGSRTSQPSYSPPRGQPLPCLPRLRVGPFIGLAVVNRPRALGAAWSTMSIQRPSCFFNLWSSCPSRPKQRRSCRMLLPPVAGCAAAEASPSPYYSHRWPGHPSTHPLPLLFCGDDSLTPQPN